jgi:hypothetical protein
MYRTTVLSADGVCPVSKLPKTLAGFSDSEVTVDEDSPRLSRRDEQDPKTGTAKTKGISLLSDPRAHGVEISISNFSNITANTDYFAPITPPLSLFELYEPVKQQLTEFRLKKKFRIFVCYSLEGQYLPQNFEVIPDRNNHHTLCPRNACDCDEVLQVCGKEKYISHSLLHCGGWRPRCLVLRAKGLLNPPSEHSDPDLWEACRVLYELYDTMDFEDFEIFKHLVQVFQELNYTWTNVRRIYPYVNMWVAALFDFLSTVDEMNDFDHIKKFKDSLLSLKDSIKNANSIHITYGAVFDEEIKKAKAKDTSNSAQKKTLKPERNKGNRWIEVDRRVLLNSVSSVSPLLDETIRELFRIGSTVSFMRNSYVVQISVPSSFEIAQLDMLLNSKAPLAQQLISCVATSVGLPVVECDTISTTMENWLSSELQDDIPCVNLEACPSNTTIFETSSFSHVQGESLATSLSNIINFFKRNSWLRSHHRFMVLCLSEDFTLNIPCIYTDDKSYQFNSRDAWTTEMSNKLSNEPILTGKVALDSTKAKMRVTAKDRYYFLLTSFDPIDAYHLKARNIVETGLLHSKIEIFRQSTFDLPSFSALKCDN